MKGNPLTQKKPKGDGTPPRDKKSKKYNKIGGEKTAKKLANVRI